MLRPTRLLRRLDFRIMPMLMLVYLFDYSARANIGNAKILNADTGDSLVQVLHITDHQFAVVLMVFVVPFVLFETPSNYLLKYFSPPRWLAFIILGWGVTDMVMAASRSYGALLGLRILLGTFEAGPWYRLQERALRLSFIIATAPLGGAFSGSIAYGIGFVNGTRGLEAWRWLFIIEGAPSCCLAVIVYFFFPSYPERASWLSSDDRMIAISRMKQETSKSMESERINWDSTKRALLDWRLYLHHLVFFALSVPLASTSLFLPTIVSELGYDGQNAQLFTVPPFAIVFVATCDIDTNAATLAIPMNMAIGALGQIVGFFIYKSKEAPGYPTGHFTNGALLLAGASGVGMLRAIYQRRNKGSGVGQSIWHV
ncbi:major facilitator superfamily domain-containing protein [Desarmillaria tabescens]|uniref:Major facilitator superfamily domain-containing protein n=1 Tax=Armillaria tabescens TaxID=1929756 RepID=A0AA39MQ05_ARMTA|nr:major facilitator superfamily domain-containing protein [Desarmillaria tabescens]KAK0442023.1 major facilitator superfamily domain-containing protein [Desarmillaria tabescens]